MTNAITQLPETLREQLILTKNEQSFSGLWVLEFEKTLSNYGRHFLLLENKGVSFRRSSGKGSKTTMNFHDISLVDSSGNFLLIIENKIWYHCKNQESSVKFLELDEEFKFFCHKEDSFVLTSNGYLWVHDLSKTIMDKRQKRFLFN
jgi:hypothetical protein